MVYSQNEKKNISYVFIWEWNRFRRDLMYKKANLGVTSFVNNDRNLTGVSIHLKDIAKTRPEVAPLTKALIAPT